MPWTCSRCRQQFAAENEQHECAGFAEFRIDGEIPNGGPGKDHDPALTQVLAIEDAIRQAVDLTLMVTGARDGFESSIDPRSLHSAIRAYRPKDKFEHVGKATNITDQDEWMHAGRIAQRLLNQALGERLALEGNWASAKAVRTRVEALYKLSRRLAERHGVDLGSLMLSA